MEEVERFVKDNLSPEHPTGRGKYTPSEDFISNVKEATKWIDDLRIGAPQSSASDEEDMMHDVNKQMSAFLGAVGNVHWALAGLSLISSILGQLETMRDNKKLAYEIMSDLVSLWRLIVQPLLNHEDHHIQLYVCEKGSSFIAGAFLFCLDHTKSSRIPRFFRGGTDKKKLEKYKEGMRDFRAELTAAVVVNIDRKLTAPAAGPSRLPSLPRSVVSNPVGLEERVANVMESMELEEKGKVRAIVLRGMGGIGKSTLADAVYDTVKPRFGKRSKIVLGQFPTEQHISTEQWKVVEFLNPGREYNNTKQADKDNYARIQMGYELKQISEPFFLYIDNVLDSHNLEDFLPEDFEDLMLPEGSRLMVTTRDKGVCDKVLAYNTRIQVVDFELPLLTLEEGKKLLCMHTFQSPEPPPDHFSNGTLVRELVEACGRLPLAIRVMGRQLRREAEAKWRFAIQEIKKGSSNIDGKADRVFTVLKYSYDQLERQDYKEAFLMATTLLVGERWYRACKVVEGMWGNPKENKGSSPILESLVDLGLIECEKMKDDPKVLKVHDLLVALGHKMANTFSTILNHDTKEKPLEYWRNIRWLYVRHGRALSRSILRECLDTLEVFLAFGLVDDAYVEESPKNLKVFWVDDGCIYQRGSGCDCYQYGAESRPPWPVDSRNIFYEEKSIDEFCEKMWFWFATLRIRESAF